MYPFSNILRNFNGRKTFNERLADNVSPAKVSNNLFANLSSAERRRKWGCNLESYGNRAPKI